MNEAKFSNIRAREITRGGLHCKKYEDSQDQKLINSMIKYLPKAKFWRGPLDLMKKFFCQSPLKLCKICYRELYNLIGSFLEVLIFRYFCIPIKSVILDHNKGRHSMNHMGYCGVAFELSRTRIAKNSLVNSNSHIRFVMVTAY